MKTYSLQIKLKSVTHREYRIQLKRIVYILLVLIFCIGFNPKILYAGYAEPDFPIKGVVVDSVSGAGISFVTIQIENNGEVVQKLASDVSGNFSFVINKPGKYNVLFHSVGYRLEKTEVTTQTGGNSDLGNVVLSPSTEQVGEVTISALKPLVRNEAEKLIYSVETDPEAKTSNVLEMLRKVPLVSVDGNDNVQLRGMSGVKFLINGKSSVALDRNTREVLRNMPSNTIKDIEVMTNPSSKYEAEGSAGIINIITTRKISDGYNGSVSAGLNTFGQYKGNVNFASKINKFVYSLNAVMNHFEGPVSFSESTRENFFSTTNRYTESNGSNKGFGNWNSFNSEASYEIDTLNLVSVSFNGNLSNNDGIWLSTTQDFDISHAVTSGYEKTGKFIGDWKNFTGTFDYQKLFQRKDRIFTFSYRYDHSLSDAKHNDKFVGLMNFPDYWQKIKINGTNNEQTLQVDYVEPFSKKNQLETGFKLIGRKNNTTNDRSMYDDNLGNWVHSDFGSNNLDYNQSVFGIYLTYQLKLKKGIFKAGLRAENTVNKGFFTSIKDTTFTNKMFNLVPFLLVTRDFEKGKSLKISYTKRLARPSAWYLNPYYDDTNPKDISMGNPQLETEISNNFDFSFSKFSEKFNLSLNMNAAFSDNLICDVSIVKPDGVRITTYKNIGNDRMVGGTVYGSVQVTKKFNVDATFGLNYRIIESNNGSGMKNSGWSNSGNFNLKFIPWNNATLLATAGSSARTIQLQGIGGRWIWSYIAYQHDFLDKKLKLETRFEGPFTKYIHYKPEQFNPQFYARNDYRYSARFLSLKLSYSFGQMKDQVKKSKKSIRNDDLK
jgi:hypothetical protein